VRRDPGPRGETNLIENLAGVRGADPVTIEAELAQARYGELKQAVAAAVIDYLTPVSERYEQLRSDDAALEAILADGAVRARAIAAATLADVRELMGVGPPRRAADGESASTSAPAATVRG
jgi:tryptophanyl-tRNA synthetase